MFRIFVWLFYGFVFLNVSTSEFLRRRPCSVSLPIQSNWLANLGIDISKNAPYGDFGARVVTLNEYREILEKITHGDPTKTGKKVYGLGGAERKTINDWNNILGAFGGCAAHYYAVNNQVTPWCTTNQFRDGFAYIAALWRDGLVDPEVYLQTNDQGKQKVINSATGGGTGEWWSTPIRFRLTVWRHWFLNRNFIHFS